MNYAALMDKLHQHLINSIPKETKSIKVRFSYDAMLRHGFSLLQLQWLSVGPAEGDRETEILRLFASHRPDLKIELLEIYELSKDDCLVLRRRVDKSREARDGTWSSVGEVVINDKELLPDTEMGSRYDLVTLMHVTYYMPDRVGVFKNIAGNLAPGGKMW